MKIYVVYIFEQKIIFFGLVKKNRLYKSEEKIS
jgi:hypothetical protein